LLRNHSSRFGILDQDRSFCIYGRINVDMRRYSGVTIHDGHRHEIGSVYPRGVPNFEVDWSPDAACDETRSPIPTILIGRFSSMRTGLLALIVSSRKLVIHLRHDGQDFINR